MNKRLLGVIGGVVVVLVGAFAFFSMNFNAPTPITLTPLAPADADVLAQFPRPQSPAEGEAFREDHPSHVASTGRPQLIEFFAFT